MKRSKVVNPTPTPNAPTMPQVPPIPVGSEDITSPRDATVPPRKPTPDSTTGTTATFTCRPLFAATLLLSPVRCGTTSGDRMASGAGIGAGAGAVVGAPKGMGPGAAIGAATEAATGRLAKKKQIDLGKPVWR